MTAPRRITRTPRTPRTPSAPAPAERPKEYGVAEGSSVAVTAALLKYDRDTPQPFCTCMPGATGFGFDPQIGIYLHADPKCWKPSKSMYAAALGAGVLEAPLSKTTETPARRIVRRPRQER